MTDKTGKTYTLTGWQATLFLVALMAVLFGIGVLIGLGAR
jgi:hypothetical protein